MSIAFLAFPATSIAATQTIGQTGTGGGVTDGVGHDDVQISTAPGTPRYSFPSDGAITQWSHLAEMGETATIAVGVYRLIAANTFLVVGKSAPMPMSAPGGITLNSFPVSPPIMVKAGDLLGMRSATGSPLDFSTGVPADSWAFRTGNAAVGGTFTGEPGPMTGTRLDIAVTFDPEETISSATASPGKFAVSKKSPAETPLAASSLASATNFSFTLSDVATVTYTIERKFRGELVNGVCAKKKKPKRNKCTGYAPVGAFQAPGIQGQNLKRFSGRIGKKKLTPGKYRATLIAKDTVGNVSEPATTTEFKVVKP